MGGIPEIIEDKKTGLLTTPANPLSLAEAIKKITSHDNIEMVEENYKNIKENFNLQQTLKKTKDIYQKLF